MQRDARGAQKCFLVTTSRSLLLVELDSGRVERLHSGQGLYYGIDVQHDRILVAARNRMVSSDVPSELERGEILAFDRGLVLRESFGADFPLRDLHQIRTIEGRLYATCSFDNAIAIRHEDGRWSQWLPLGRPACAPWDHNHFNTVEYVAGNICLVAHNHGASEVLLFDAGTHELRQRIPLGVQAHNLWKSGDEWNVCSSAEGRLAGTRGFARETGGFPRGIFIGADFAIVGISELAERAARDFTNGELVVYDADWRECDRIVFSNEGLVLDIAELPPQEGAKP